MRSLRARLTLSYALLVATVLAILGVALTHLAFDFLTRPLVDAVHNAAIAARGFVAADPGISADALRAKVVATESRSSAVVIVVHHGPPRPRGMLRPPEIMRRPPDAMPPPPNPAFGRMGRGPDPFHRSEHGIVPAIVGWMFGLHPEVIPLHDGVLFIAPDFRRIDSSVRAYIETLGLALILAGVGAWLIARWITSQAIAPLIEVTSKLQRFAGGDFEPRPVTTSDKAELGALTAAYNGAAAQVAAAFEERRQVEEYMRRFVADAGHELRTPLTVVRAYLEILRKGGVDDPRLRDRAFKTLGGEMDRMRDLIDRLIALARLERTELPAPSIVDLAEAARVAVDVETTARGGEVSIDAPDPVLVLAEPNELHEAVANLIDNALKYAPGSQVVVQVEQRGQEAIVRVRDGGPGIDEHEQARIFERFYRGDGHGDVAGSGLGLAIAARAAERAGGRIVLESARPGATSFALVLPAHQPAASRVA